MSSPPYARTEPGWVGALRAVGAFVVLLWVVEVVDVLVNHRLDGYGVEPRDTDGLLGIVFAPVLHASWDHLIANTAPVLVLGFLVLLGGIAQEVAASHRRWR